MKPTLSVKPGHQKSRARREVNLRALNGKGREDYVVLRAANNLCTETGISLKRV